MTLNELFQHCKSTYKVFYVQVIGTIWKFFDCNHQIISKLVVAWVSPSIEYIYQDSKLCGGILL